MIAPVRGAEYVAQIAAGKLYLRTIREEIPLSEALDFAARNNPKRPFLFVSRVLGRHLPTRPSQIRHAAGLLAEKLRAAGVVEPCLFVGMAETATTLGQAVFREWQELGGAGLYLDSTRRQTGGSVAFEFNESHSHAPGHLIHLPTLAEDPDGIFASAGLLVIIDDEMTTGRTALQLAAAYSAWRRKSIPAELAVLVRWASSETTPENVRIHALIEGDFEFVADAAFIPARSSGSEATVKVLAPRGSRQGVGTPQDVASSNEMSPSTEHDSILIIGVGEFGFVPLRLAEELERRGAQAFLQATTRSPVALGGAVQHVRTFPAITGEGYPEFLYNVPDDHPYARVILCCEDAVPPLDHPIRLLPRLGCHRLEAR